MPEVKDIIFNKFYVVDGIEFPKYYVVIIDVFDASHGIYMHKDLMHHFRRILNDSSGLIITCTSLNRMYDFGTRRKPMKLEVFGRVRLPSKTRVKNLKEKYPEYFI